MSPVEMSFLSSLVEVEVGSSLYLPLQVLGKTPEEPPLTLPFYDCRFMGFKFSLADDAIFNVSLDQNISKRGRGDDKVGLGVLLLEISLESGRA